MVEEEMLIEEEEEVKRDEGGERNDRRMGGEGEEADRVVNSIYCPTHIYGCRDGESYLHIEGYSLSIEASPILKSMVDYLDQYTTGTPANNS
jgi:hypothetical protein